jgi:hypothetical protein
LLVVVVAVVIRLVKAVCVKDLMVVVVVVVDMAVLVNHLRQVSWALQVRKTQTAHLLVLAVVVVE